MDYDTWKLMTPEEASNIQYEDVEVEIGVWVTLDEYKKNDYNSSSTNRRRLG